jgi:hypothetical protein
MWPDSLLAKQIFGAQKEHILCAPKELISLHEKVDPADRMTYANVFTKAWRKRAYHSVMLLV